MDAKVLKWYKKGKEMLLGTYYPTLIGKNRLALPMKLRKEIKGNVLVLSVGFEDCIFGFEEKKWEEVTAADLSRPISDVAGRDLKRRLCMNAERVALDSHGRFVVPDAMMKYAGIINQIVIIGAGDHFEIWEEKIWIAYKNQMEGKK